MPKIVNEFKPSSNFITDRFMAVLLLWILLVIMFHVCLFIILSCLVITCWDRADPLVLLYVMVPSIVTLSHG